MICKGKEKSVTGLSTLCYIEKDGKYLMLHRTVKKNDVNKDKWIGVGGHFEADESPEECILREVKEETVRKAFLKGNCEVLVILEDSDREILIDDFSSDEDIKKYLGASFINPRR